MVLEIVDIQFVFIGILIIKELCGYFQEVGNFVFKGEVEEIKKVVLLYRKISFGSEWGAYNCCFELGLGYYKGFIQYDYKGWIYEYRRLR